LSFFVDAFRLANPLTDLLRLSFLIYALWASYLGKAVAIQATRSSIS